MLTGGRPDRVVAQLSRLRRFGPTLAGAYASAAARTPGHPAVIDETTTRTFGELDRRAAGIARGLAALGVGPQRSVAVLAANSVAFVEALVATSRLGADALLLSTFLSAAQAREVLLREAPTVVVADPELLPLLAQAPPGVVVVTTRPVPGPPESGGSGSGGSGSGESGSGGSGSLPAGRSRTLDGLAGTPGADPVTGGRRGRLVVLTSGTTGVPKGARRPAPTSLSPAASMLSRLRLRRGDRIMISCPLFHTWALGVLQIAPALGAAVVLRRRADPEVVLDAVAVTGCTALIAVPVILERILELAEPVRARLDTSRLRVVASSGSALTREVATRFQDTFGEVLYNIYGSTEISWATIATPQDLRAAAGTAGRPPLGTRLALLDDDGAAVPPGEVGRIFVGNDLLFEGYTSGSDKERLHGLMATGDRGYLDPTGLLMVVGREDDLVISGSEKIYPLEVEQVLAAMPGVREVAVVGRPDEQMGQRLVAYVVCQDGVQLGEQAVQDHVRQRLARFAVPRSVVFLGELPRTPTGKVVPRLLPAP